MANPYFLATKTEAAGVAAAKFITQGVRQAGKTGLVDEVYATNKTYPSSSTSGGLPQVALVKGEVSQVSSNQIVDISTGKPLEDIAVHTLFPCLSLKPVSSNRPYLVFYGTTGYLDQVITEL